WAVGGLVVATLVLTALMLLWNYYITPIYMEIPRSVVVSMLPTVFLPFNLVKGFINSGLILLVYRPVVDTLRRTGLVAASAGAPKKKLSVSLLVGLVLLAVFIPVLLSMA
ncbi:MAG: ECF transporter S component, partial [Clostridia bacterium]|nr:ECF transporter S component [Clostridia bacterium]